MENIFLKNLIPIATFALKKAPDEDWSVVLDLWKNEYLELFEGLDYAAIANMKIAFYSYIDGRTDIDGKELMSKAGARKYKLGDDGIAYEAIPEVM